MINPGDLSRAAIQQEDTLSQDDDDDQLNSGDHSQHTFQTKRNFLRIQCGKCDLPIRFGVLYVKCQHCKGWISFMLNFCMLLF